MSNRRVIIKKQADDYTRRANDALRMAEPYKRRIADYQKRNMDIDRKITQLEIDYRRELEREKRK